MKIKRQAIAALACGLLSTPIVYAQGDPGTYWTNPEGETWKNAEGECWKNPDWTKADATRECDPDLVPKPKPKPAPPPPPPQPAPPPEPAPVVEEVSLAADAHFAIDSAELRPDAIEQIRRLADRAENIKDLGIEVSGHTDSTGSEEYNLGLSNRRAASVKEALIEEGIDPGVIMTRGYGETAPVASNDTAEGRAKNRRVDITVTGIKRIMP